MSLRNSFPRINANSIIPSSSINNDKVFRPDLNIKLACSQCNNQRPKIIEEYTSGDLVCGDCGLVLEDRIIDTSSEWRNFANNDEGNNDPSRVGALVFDGEQLDATIISKTNSYTSSSKFASDDQSFSRKTNLSKIQANMNKDSLRQPFKEIDSMCSLLDLKKDVSDTSKQLYKRIVDEKLFRSRKDKNYVFATCIYIACRIKKVGRTMLEISSATQVLKTEIVKCFSVLTKTFELNLGVMTSEDLITRFCNRLQLSPEITKISLDVSKQAESLGHFTGRTQTTIAAGCIYFVCRLKNEHDVNNNTNNINEIAKVAGVGASSIKFIQRELKNIQNQFSGRAKRFYQENNQTTANTTPNAAPRKRPPNK
ncbi:10540_t:CDS:2 [Entrophospora sp. SA101]|nr:10540_t:CDS:2 [Entrophospora sp. SA101]CAJ0906058.1 12467_t:CDS:2 [Entrophospora sp. SA101]